MTARIHVSLPQGSLEVEGSEDFVRQAYTEFCQHVALQSHARHVDSGRTQSKQATKTTAAPTAADEPNERGRGVTGTAPRRNAGRSKRVGGNTANRVDRDLDLSPAKDGPSLKQYLAQFAPRTNFERNLLFVAYLQDVRGISAVSARQVYTCYRDVGAKVPEALDDSLYDSSRKRGWITTSSLENITLTTRGRNYLEHDLARAKP